MWLYSRFYGGAPDALIGGSNIEISPALTWKRRPGLSVLGANTSVYPSAPLTAFSFYNTDGSINLYVDTATGVYLHNNSGAPTLLFTKSAGAGQTAFLQLGDVLYFSNGVDNKKLINSVVYNWASSGPAAAPSVTVNSIGAGAVAGVPWTASTVFTTMGLLEDSNSNIQQLISVNADGTNTANATTGTSGVGEPVWPTSSGSTVTETSGLQWENFGPIVGWTSATKYQDATIPGSTATPCMIYEPTSGNVFIANVSGGGAANSGTKKPNFSAVPLLGSVTDGAVKWFNVGAPQTWTPGHVYSQWGTSFGHNDPNAFVCSPTTPKAAGVGTATSPQTVYLQVVVSSGGGTSDSSHTGPKWANSLSSPTTRDGQLSYQYLGSAAWASGTAYTAWQSGATAFGAVYDGTNFQVCITSGTSGTGTPSWGTTYGAVVTETSGSGVQWVCVGSPMSWAASTKWYLPSSGFQPPVAGVDPYGGSNVLDSNGNAEFVTNSGKSSSAHPAWPTVIGGTVTESSGPTWTLTALKANIAGSTALVFTKGYAYVYAWKSRTANDFYVTNAPNGAPGALGVPTGSATGGITVASPVFQMPTGANPGAQMQVSGAWPTDLQYDTVVIYRCEDGSQGGPYLELTELAVPPAVNGVVPGNWKFFDTVTDINLNTLIEADVVGLNTPPPTGLTNLAFHMGRIWGNVGNVVYGSSGPDILPDNGNGLEGWAPANNFPLKAAVNKLIATQSGLLTFTASDVVNLAGGPAITNFFPFTVAKGLGLLSPNAIIENGGEIYLFTADRRFIALQPGVGHTELGFPIADQLANFNPQNVYLTEHAAGNDSSAFYLGDGATGWFRLNAHQSPDNSAIWSPFATVTGGVGMVQSIQTSSGVRTLLVGPTASGNILKRDPTVNLDNGTSFHCYFVIGSIVLAHPGQLCELGFVTMEFANQGNPITKYLLNEISGDFFEFGSWVSDPPLVYGTTSTPSSYSPRRYYFQQTPKNSGEQPPPLLVRHMQLRVDYPAENAAHELVSFCLNGALFAEG
jgi:hypothetical protein